MNPQREAPLESPSHIYTKQTTKCPFELGPASCFPKLKYKKIIICLNIFDNLVHPRQAAIETNPRSPT